MQNEIIKLKNKINKLDKYYLSNYGLIIIAGIEKIIDLYLTYEGMRLDENFVEKNPLMKDIIHNKPLTYILSAGYIGLLGSLNYLAYRAGKYLKYRNMNKITTAGLGMSLLINLYIILENLKSLMNLKWKPKL